MADWEQCKENAMPLKRGRNPKSFKAMNAAGEIAKEKERILTQQDRFEDMLTNATSDGPMEDPLAIWIDYIKWMQDHATSGNRDLISLFERCTREFKSDERYKNNEKYLKIWIGYADMLENPSAVFKYLRENGIGERLALYYIATAWTAERRNDFPLADKAYTVGIEKKAQPLELLQKRHREFQRRMSRRWLDQAEKERRGEDINEEDDEEEQYRRSLQTLSEAEAGSMHRPTGRSAVPVHANITGRSTGLGRGISSSRQTPKPTFGDENVENSKFSVFVEKQPQSAKDDWGSSDVGGRSQTGWKYMETRQEQSKENSIEAGPWTRQGFGSVSPALDPHPGTRSHGPAFGVFVDAEPEEHHSFSVKNDSSPRNSAPTQVKLKERPKKTKTDTESLLKKPLQNFDKEDLPTTREVQKTAVSEDLSKFADNSYSGRNSEDERQHIARESSTLQQLAQDDVTINTRMALDDMFELFGSPSMKAMDTKPISGGTHSSGNEESVEHVEDQGERSSIPFSIFQDTPPSTRRPSKPKSSAPFSVFSSQEEPTAAPKSSAPFSVFSASHSPSMRPSRSADAENPPARTAPFSIFTETGSTQGSQRPTESRVSSRSLYVQPAEEEIPERDADYEDFDAENFDLRGHRINERRGEERRIPLDDDSVLRERDPENSVSMLVLEDDESEDEQAEEKEDGPVVEERFSNQEPVGFRHQRGDISSLPKFSIYSDDGEIVESGDISSEDEDELHQRPRGGSHAPLESILEISDEADDNSAAPQPRRAPFSIFRD